MPHPIATAPSQTGLRTYSLLDQIFPRIVKALHEAVVELPNVVARSLFGDVLLGTMLDPPLFES